VSCSGVCFKRLRRLAQAPLQHMFNGSMKQPLGIEILSWFAALASAGMFVSIALTILDIGPHLMGGEKVTRFEWLHIAAPLVAVIGCLMASIAYGFATRKAWSRHLVMAIFVLIIVYASALGALNVLRHTIMWRAIVKLRCLVVPVRGTSTSNEM